MGHIKTLAGQTFIYGAGTIVPRLLNYLLLTPFYTRIFNTAQYGKITELYAYVAFLLVILTFGMETTFFRYFQKKGRARLQIYNVTLSCILLSTVLFIILLFSFLNPINNYLGNTYSNDIFIFIAFIIACDVISAIPFAKLRSENKAFLFSIVKIVSVSINIGFNFLLLVVLPGFITKGYFSGFSDYFSAQNIYKFAFISNLLGSLFSLIFVFKVSGSFSFSLNRRILNTLLAYSWPILIIGICGMINEVADKIMLRWLLIGKSNLMEQIGIYGANYKLAVLMTIFIQMFRYAADPFFFSYRDSKERMMIFGSVLKWFIIFCLTIYLGITLFIDVAKYFIGSEFHSGLKIVPIVLAANIFFGIYYNISVWFKLSHMNYIGAIIAVVGAAVTIIANWILVPEMGYLGAAWATFICFLVMMLLSYFLSYHFFHIKYPLKSFMMYFIIALFLYILSYYCKFGILFNLIIFISFVIFIIIKEGLFTEYILKYGKTKNKN